MLKKIKWVDVRIFLMFFLVLFLYSFASKRNERRRMTDIEVAFIGTDNLYITQERINSILQDNLSFVGSVKKDHEVIKHLEKVLNTNTMIDEAQVYKSIDGVLKAEIVQKKPIGRVVNGSSNFYIDSKGHKMPLSDNYSARVPLVTGKINESNKDEIFEILSKIDTDDFLKKSIIGIQILPSGSLVMSDRNFDYKILFGKVVNEDRKFNNYKAFMQHALQDTIIKNYKLINLKFTQQVVCTK